MNVEFCGGNSGRFERKSSGPSPGSATVFGGGVKTSRNLCSEYILV